MTPHPKESANLNRTRNTWLRPWQQPAPWIALGLLGITAVSSPPRLWFWLSLLVVVLVVGWVQALRSPRS